MHVMGQRWRGKSTPPPGLVPSVSKGIRNGALIGLQGIPEWFLTEGSHKRDSLYILILKAAASFGPEMIWQPAVGGACKSVHTSAQVFGGPCGGMKRALQGLGLGP